MPFESQPNRRFHSGLKPVNTLDSPQTSSGLSKSHFLKQSLRSSKQSPTLLPPPPPKAPQSPPQKRDLSLTIPRSESSRKRLRLSYESPDVLQEEGLRSTQVSLEHKNHVIHDLSSSPKEHAADRRGNSKSPSMPRNSSPLKASSSRSVRFPFAVFKPTNPKKGPSHQDVVSDDEEEQFTKTARQQRKREETSDTDVLEISDTKQTSSSARKTRSESPSSVQQRIGSPSQLLNKLEAIIPEAILDRQQEQASISNVIQHDGPFTMDESASTTARRSGKAPVASNTRTVDARNAPKMSQDQKTPANIVKFYLRRMLFGSFPDGEHYVLLVNKATRTFNIDHRRNELSDDPLLEGFSVTKIHKVHHCTNGPRVRIATAQMSNIGHVFLFELASHKLALDLARLLQKLGTEIKVDVVADEYMDKWFRNFNASTKYTINGHGSPKQNDLRSPYWENPDLNQRSEVAERSSTKDGAFESSDIVLKTSQRLGNCSANTRRRHSLQEDLQKRPMERVSSRERIGMDPVLSHPRNTMAFSHKPSPRFPPPKHSEFSKLGLPWKDPLTYPKNGKKRATVNFDDLSRLDDDEFLNDNLVGFFLRYLEEYLDQEDPDISKRCHFFNSYFYEKLRQNSKDKRNINYEGVKKWTEKIGLFNRDFIVVPVNESLHWYVAIICNLSWFKLSDAEKHALDARDMVDESQEDPPTEATEDTAMEDENNTQKSMQELSIEDRELRGDILVSDVVPASSGSAKGSAKKKGRKRKSDTVLRTYSLNRPAIITLDSLGTPRYGTVKALKQYIVQEGGQRLGLEIPEGDIQGLTAKKIPMQDNSSDCGLFVCAYLEKFAMNPENFKRKELGRIPQAWPNLHSHDLRGRMRDLILRLHEEQESGNAANKPLPRVGEILLSPVKPPRPPREGTPAQVENGDEKMYDAPTSPVEHDARAGAGADNEKPRIRDQPDESEDELARVPKMQHRGLAPQANSEHEAEVHRSYQDNPLAMAKRLAETRSPKIDGRHQSVSTEFLTGEQSFVHTEDRMPDDDELMLV